jgi:hypothetical protein
VRVNGARKVRVNGALGVGVERAVEVAADVADAGEQAGALAFVRVRFQLFDELDLKD